jgi:thymidylate synthase ThyX
MFEDSTERFTPQETALLQPFVTNTERPIFCLRNLPEVVKGALFSRYSRSPRSLRRLLLDEFMSAPESGFHALVAGAGADPAAQLVAAREAEAFYDRVLIGYGDDSVAELGGAHIACEGVSNIAAKLLEDSRLGLSPLEKSTRYVRFDLPGPDGYAYLREPALMASPYAARFTAAMDNLFSTYGALLAPVQTWLQAQFPRDPETSQRAHASAIRAKSFDLLRGLLPMATRTNVRQRPRLRIPAHQTGCGAVCRGPATRPGDAGRTGPGDPRLRQARQKRARARLRNLPRHDPRARGRPCRPARPPRVIPRRRGGPAR